jgi:alpha-ribazole phosphatase CobZ
VVSTTRGELIEYAGTATKLGEMIGTSVKKSVKEAIKKQEGIIPNRPLIQRLKERGITPEDLINVALELFLPHPGIETREKASKLLEEGFNQALSDVNIAALVMAGFRLEEDGQCSLIPSLLNKTFKKDPTFFVADEILGMAIANYIGGSKGIFEYVRFDKAKPGIIKKLGPISDDVIAGLVAGVSSNMYTRAMGQR